MADELIWDGSWGIRLASEGMHLATGVGFGYDRGVTGGASIPI